MAHTMFQHHSPQLTKPVHKAYGYRDYVCGCKCSSSGRFGHGVHLPGLNVGTAEPNRRVSNRIKATTDWNYGAFHTASDWSVTPGVYSDPRAAPAGPQRQPPQQDGFTDGPSTSYEGNQVTQDADPLSEVARTVVDAVTGFLAFLVGRLSDAALSLLPAYVKRRAVENSVKGALALLGLALLQSVLAFVLTVGTLVLAVYTAHQVFGVQLPFLPGGAGGGGAGQDGPGSANQTDPRFYSSGGAQQQEGYYGPGTRQQGYRYNTGYGGRGQPYPPRPGARGGAWANGPRGSRQGPTIDVYYEGP